MPLDLVCMYVCMYVCNQRSLQQHLALIAFKSKRVNMRFNALLFLALLTSVSALKGQTGLVRRHVQEAPLPPGQPKVVGGDPKGVPQADPKAGPTTVGDPKSANDPKALSDPKADPKAVKDPKADPKAKDAKKKKCKKVKKTKGALIFEESAQYPAQAPLVAPEEKFCLQGERSEAECAAAASAQLPQTDKKVKGSISFEISSDKDANQLQKDAEQFLSTKTSHAFIGCATTSRRLQDDTSEVPPTTEESMEVTGVGFDSFKNGECTLSDAEGCSKLEANVDIYYSGEDAPEPKQDEMFALLMETINRQVQSGEFQNEVGTLRAVEANSLSSDTSAEGTSGGDDTAKKSIPSGVVVGILAAVAGVVGYKYHKKRKSKAAAARESKNHETDESDNEGAVEVHATLVEEKDEKKGWFTKKE